MITISVNDKHQKIIIKFPYSTESVDLVKNILNPYPVYNVLKVGGSEVKKFSHWEMIPDADSRARLEGIKSNLNFKISESVWALFEIAQGWRDNNYFLSGAHNSDIEVKNLGGSLMPFQRAAVDYLNRNSRGAMLADEMGLGKTISTLAALEYNEGHRLPALIVCPAVVKYNWFNECVKWLPHRSVSVIDGSAEITPAEIVIVNYDLLERRLEDLDSYEWHTIIFDESHYLKGYKSQRTQAAQKLAANIPARWLLSGTPILNRPQDLLTQLSIMDRLQDLGGFWPFANRYCQAKQTRHGWDFSGAANLDELNKKLREVCYIRREKKAVLKELPEKTRVYNWMKIDNLLEYRQAESDLIGYLKENARLPVELENASPEEKREYREQAAYKASRAEAIVKINVLKQLAARGKIQAAESWIDNFFANYPDKKLVVFCWHKFIIDSLANEYECKKITGESSPEEKTEIVKAFQDGPDKILVCNIQAGGVGITLTAADTMLILELGWNPGVMDQAEDRINRMGQKNATTIYYMLGESTVDRDFYDLIEYKRTNTESALDGFEFIAERIRSRNG